MNNKEDLEVLRQDPPLLKADGGHDTYASADAQPFLRNLIAAMACQVKYDWWLVWLLLRTADVGKCPSVQSFIHADVGHLSPRKDCKLLRLHPFCGVLAST